MKISRSLFKEIRMELFLYTLVHLLLLLYHIVITSIKRKGNALWLLGC
jgi:hypothetical protein